MGGEFRLHHGSATTEKAAAAAGRVEAIVGDVVNGNRKAWGRIDVEDIALLVQHARDAAASPDWLSKMAIDALVTRWETAKAERDAAVARAEAAEAEAERLRGLLSAERDGYAAGVADGRKAGAGEERDLIVACLRDFEKNGSPGLLSGAAQHIEAGCHWPDPLTSVW